MKRIRRIVGGTAAAVLSVGLLAGLAPAASAVDDATGCSQADRAALRQEIGTLKGQILGLRLTPEQVAEKKAARRQAIEDIKAEYGVPGTKLTAEKRAAMKAEIDAAIGQGRQASADRRAQIDPLKAQLLAAHDKLQACRTAAKPAQ